jgi:hypothetical protein
MRVCLQQDAEPHRGVQQWQIDNIFRFDIAARKTLARASHKTPAACDNKGAVPGVGVFVLGLHPYLSAVVLVEQLSILS